MTSRGLSTATANALVSNSLEMATLVKMYFTTAGLTGMTDYGSIINTNVVGVSENFIPTEFMVTIGDTTESSSLEVAEITLAMSAADINRTYLNYGLNGAYFNSRIIIARAFLNGTSVIGTPYTFFDGRVKNFSFSEQDGESEVEFTLASHWTDFEKINCRRTNRQSQQRYFPDDTGLNWAADAIKEIRWGRKDLDDG